MLVTLRHFFIAPGHSYFGRHGQGAAAAPVEEPAELRCVAGRGVIGDRFFDYKPNYKGQITLFSWEVFENLRRELSAERASPAALRRTVIVEGLDLDVLIDARFTLQGVAFEGIEECRPCYWMDQAIAPGAERWLKGRGGLRCKILSDGVLRLGAASFDTGYFLSGAA